MAASPRRFRGIRHSTTWDASDTLRSEAPRGLLGDSKFRRGFAWLAKLDLSFDAWVYHPQLTEVAELARAFPSVPIILNHIGAPLGVGPYAGKRAEVFQLWSSGIVQLAKCPNVVVKLGGLGSMRSGYDWHKRAVKPSSLERKFYNLTSSIASRNSVLIVACSRAISQWKNLPTHMSIFGTASSA
jgi:predicted TIM-barrel fold metal-dependent hydrolase